MKTFHLIPLSLLLLGACTEEAPTFSTLESDCRNKCRIVVYLCPTVLLPDPGEAETLCVDECNDIYKDKVLDLGNQCALSYERMMACGGKLETCSEVLAWLKRWPENPCREESASFDQECEGFY